ncbi:hypothetical protein GJ496_008475 [Pomphorhynchus laevis]|nr:hypothetical protein GJ496_008475 [Pomphorhynchus laevis]
MSPADIVYSYKRGLESVDLRHFDINCGKLSVGDKVYVKPNNAICITKWNPWILTGTGNKYDRDLNRHTTIAETVSKHWTHFRKHWNQILIPHSKLIRQQKGRFELEDIRHG